MGNEAPPYASPALVYYQKCLAIKLKKLGPDHPSVATSYNSIGAVYDSKGDPTRARDYLEKTLAIYESRGDEDKAQDVREKIAGLESEQPID